MTAFDQDGDWGVAAYTSGLELRNLFYWVGPSLILMIYVGSMVSFGYAYEDTMRGICWCACGLLGLWGTAFWAAREFSLRPYAALRSGLVVGSGVVCWTGLTLVPLPAAWVSALSPYWREALSALDAAGYGTPDRIPWAISPEAAQRGWNQLVASLLFAWGACVAASRPRGFKFLAALAAAVSIVESVIGTVIFVAGDTDRAFGVAFNSNHHAALIMLGLPLAAWWAMTRNRHSRYGYAEVQRMDLTLLAGGIVCISFIGWLLALSRGSLAAFCLVVLAFGVHGLLRGRGGHHRKAGNRSFFAWRGQTILLFIAGACALALLGFSSAIEGFMGRAENNVGDFLGRVAYWKATLAGWGRSPILGLGLGGTEAAINRFLTDRPTSVQAVWSHNDYVQVFAELGLAGSAALLAGIAWFGFRARLEWMEQGPALGRRLGGMRLAILAGLAMTLIHALFDFHLRLPLVGFQFLLLSALLLTGTKGMISRS